MSILLNHPYVSILQVEGTPPEKYMVEYRIEGLVQDSKNEIKRGKLHRAEVFLPKDYPRRPPFCRMLTPVFHPNIDAQKICIGDHWNAGQRLVHTIIRIGEMITYQSYNVKSPLNGAAAAWAELNHACLPLQKIDLFAGL